MLLAAGVVAALCAAPAAAPAAEGSIEFRNAFDASLLDVRPKPGEQPSEAVQTFHATGRNPYLGNRDTLSTGRKLYETWCQSCHMPDGTGRMGPSLVGDSYTYERVATDVGMFEVVFGGAGGAMQAFGRRISQDEILKVIAYVRSLKR